MIKTLDSCTGAVYYLDMKLINLFASAALLAASLQSAELPIGTDQKSGNVNILSIAEYDDFTVFIRSRTCETRAVAVQLILSGMRPGERYPIKIARFNDCGMTAERITFPVDGRKVLEIRVNELSLTGPHTFRP